MSFIHPWALIVGTAALALPVAIHWLTRPRPRRLALSTIRFVQEAVMQRRARHRLRDAAILTLRTLAILCLAWAIARPLTGVRPLVVAGHDSAAVRVVIVDTSQSMAAESTGVRLFERARPAAAAYLSGSSGFQANLVLAGAAARPVFDRVSTNFSALREELANAQVRPERLNAQAALKVASQLLAAAGGDPQRSREVVIVSDFQASNWSSVDFSVLPADTKIQLDAVSLKDSPANLAIVRVASPGRIEHDKEGKLEVEVGNFSSTPRTVQVEVVIGDAAFRLDGLCAPWQKKTLSLDVPLRKPGWQNGIAKLLDVHDALPADNNRAFVMDVRPPPTIGLLTRQPADVVPSSSYYLERALAPAVRKGQAETRVTRLDHSLPDREAFAAADAFVLDHPGKLTSETISLLAAVLRRGRGILYVASEPADAINLKLLADVAGTELQMPVDFAPVPPGQQRRDLFLAETQREQAPFRVFGDSLAALTTPLRFNGGLTTRRREGALSDDVLASFNDRSACLVMTSCGAGTLAVLNADLSSSNLPSSAVFVPLVGEIINRLLGQQTANETVASGEPMAVFLPSALGPASGLSIRAPDGGPGAGQLVEEASAALWRSSEAPSPGVYQILRGSETVYSLASVVPGEESDLRTMDPAVFQGRLSGGRQLHHQSAQSDESSEDSAWVGLLVACIVCILGEWLALKVFRT